MKEITMTTCNYLAACPFFNDRMPIETGMGHLYKTNYCGGAFVKCARYMVVQALGKGTAPADLYPSQQSRVADIIAKGKAG
jgi:hypothetical protein